MGDLKWWWSRPCTNLGGREKEGYFKSVENIQESSREKIPAQSLIFISFFFLNFN